MSHRSRAQPKPGTDDTSPISARPFSSPEHIDARGGEKIQGRCCRKIPSPPPPFATIRARRSPPSPHAIHAVPVRAAPVRAAVRALPSAPPPAVRARAPPAVAIVASSGIHASRVRPSSRLFGEGRGRGCRPDGEASRAAAARRAGVSATGGVLRESAGERRGRAGPSPACSSSPATPFFFRQGRWATCGLRGGGLLGCVGCGAGGLVGCRERERELD